MKGKKKIFPSGVHIIKDFLVRRKHRQNSPVSYISPVDYTP